MKIGVLSDTHLRAGQSLPLFVWDHLQGVDLILHAGDILSSYVISDLEAIAPVRAVRGNCDGWEVAHLPGSDIIEIEKIRIGLVHGYSGSGTTPDRALKTFAQDRVNAVVFGHSHIPLLEWRGDILLFNPGSPTDKRREPRYSMGLMEISQGLLKAEHLFF